MDRYLVGPQGYFLELPDGSLSRISPRIAFPLIKLFPALSLSDLETQGAYGKNTYFIAAPLASSAKNQTHAVAIEDLFNHDFAWTESLSEAENHLILRLCETGLIAGPVLSNASDNRRNGQSLGQSLIEQGICSWEFMLTVCLDNPQPEKLDPNPPDKIYSRHEWERIGEILFTLGKINRTQLETALKTKHEGQKALGQILVSMGACRPEDIEAGLKVQKEVRESFSSQIALVGQLLIGRGVITAQELEDAIRHQKVGRQPLSKILLAMGVCRTQDIADYAAMHNQSSFQSEIDDLRLGEWLVKIDTITRQQLQEALRIQMRGRQVLGELLISLQLCSPEQIQQTLSLQKNLRSDYHTGIEKLGVLLLKQGKITTEQLQEALELQCIGRQAFGCILAAMGACSSQDVQLALNLQQRWKEEQPEAKDRLGEVLMRQGLISPQRLSEILPYHEVKGRPLGQILVEKGICSPEQIISALLIRDRDRQESFARFLQAAQAEIKQQLSSPTGN